MARTRRSWRRRHLVIAVLNGNNIAGLFTPMVYIVKMVGTCTSRMAGLALGPEAPMVHLGACIASLIFAVERKVWGDATKTKSRYGTWIHDVKPAFSNSGHREMVSAGTAAGLAAAFGAPIGGVLFALEEACSVWSRKNCVEVFIMCSDGSFYDEPAHAIVSWGWNSQFKWYLSTQFSSMVETITFCGCSQCWSWSSWCNFQFTAE